jgi:lipid-A-disaccharide synthase
MISTGEASGELYGVLLSREIKRLWPDVEIFGIGGSRMRAEGISMIAEGSGIMGITEAIGQLMGALKGFRRASDALRRLRPDLLVLIDYPDFNLALARRAKRMGIPVLYYVSPQVWAWRKGRIKRIASTVDRVALLLPFEVDYYKDTGVPFEFVGHPVVETIEPGGSQREMKEEIGLDPERPLITLLPGSRPVEVRRHIPILKEVASILHRQWPRFQIAIPVTEDTGLDMEIEDYIRIIRGKTIKALACSEASAIASGTATLEAALLGVPMVVFYRVSYITYLIARLLVRVRYISLVNLIAGRGVVKELIQRDVTPENIFSELKALIEDHSYRDRVLSGLRMVKEAMEGKRPSERVALMAGEMAGWTSTDASWAT